MLRATFATLRQILLDLGFTVVVVPDSHVWFEYPGTDTRILLRPFRDDEVVDAANLVAVRRLLDERGLLPRQRFDDLLRERSLAG